MAQSIDVHIFMERGMYGRLVDRAQELGLPMSAVVREAVVRYFEEIPEAPDRMRNSPVRDDPVWQIPTLSETYGALRVPDMGQGSHP